MDANTSRADALATFTAEIQRAVNRYLDDMTAVRERLDAEINSPAEIERLRTSCKGRPASMAEDMSGNPCPQRLNPDQTHLSI